MMIRCRPRRLGSRCWQAVAAKLVVSLAADHRHQAEQELGGIIPRSWFFPLENHMVCKRSTEQKVVRQIEQNSSPKCVVPDIDINMKEWATKRDPCRICTIAWLPKGRATDLRGDTASTTRLLPAQRTQRYRGSCRSALRTSIRKTRSWIPEDCKPLLDACSHFATVFGAGLVISCEFPVQRLLRICKAPLSELSRYSRP